VVSSLAVVGSDVEAVFTFHLIVQSSAFSEHDLCVSGPTVEQNDFERQLGPPFVHRVPAYFIYYTAKNDIRTADNALNYRP